MADSLTGIIFLALIFSLEYRFPFFSYPGKRIRHALNNLFLASMNAGVVILSGGCLVNACGFYGRGNWGLLHRIDIGPVGKGFLAVILMDIWMYTWHRMNHEISFFWRFHRVHHTDPAMDSTTAVRFHPAEILFSHILNFPVLLILGVTLPALVTYKACSFPVILFHHSNIAFAKRWDSAIGKIFVMPNMHRVHHSKERRETDSNYGSIFSLWDRLFKTFREREDTRAIVFGIGAFTQDRWQGIKGMLRIPFLKSKD